MKKVFSLALILLGLMMGVPSKAQRPIAYIPAIGPYENDGRTYVITSYIDAVNMDWIHPSYDESLESKIPVYWLPNFNVPSATMEYKEVPAHITISPQFRKSLQSPENCNVIVRLPEQCGNAAFIEAIETKLSSLEFNILDHNMAYGIRSPREIGQKSGADILVDVSWLKFSDPEMQSDLDFQKCKIGTDLGPLYYDGKRNRSHGYYLTEKELNKYLSTGKVKGNPYYLKYLNLLLDNSVGDGIIKEVVKEIRTAECFGKNKNTISAIFKFIDTKTGRIIGSFHVGVSDVITQKIDGAKYRHTDTELKIDGLSNWKNEKGRQGYDRNPNSAHIIDPWNKERYSTFEGSIPAAWILTNISAHLGNTEIPHAKQLNDFQEVKLSDDTVIEQGSSTSHTNRSYSGRGRTYYNRWFNSSYWSGGSSSTTDSSYSSTTSFKEAEYLRPQDFYGYYTPITNRLVEELRKLQQGK